MTSARPSAYNPSTLRAGLFGGLGCPMGVRVGLSVWLANHRSRSFPACRPHRKLVRYQISDRVAGMRSHRVRFVQISQRIAVRIRLPTHLFEILDEVLAALIDQHPTLSGMVSPQPVHPVVAILHRWIGARYTNVGVVAIGVAAEKLL